MVLDGSGWFRIGESAQEGGAGMAGERGRTLMGGKHSRCLVNSR